MDEGTRAQSERLIRVEEQSSQILRTVTDLDRKVGVQNGRVYALEKTVGTLGKLEDQQRRMDGKVDDLERSRDELRGAIRLWGLLLVIVSPVVSSLVALAINAWAGR